MVEKNLKAKYAHILLRPRISEKANLVVAQNQHTFEIAAKATKKQVTEAIKAFYNVSPIKVNIVKNPSKTIRVKGRMGKKAGVKKAVVFLKEGDKIE